MYSMPTIISMLWMGIFLFFKKKTNKHKRRCFSSHEPGAAAALQTRVECPDPQSRHVFLLFYLEALDPCMACCRTTTDTCVGGSDRVFFSAYFCLVAFDQQSSAVFITHAQENTPIDRTSPSSTPSSRRSPGASVDSIAPSFLHFNLVYTQSTIVIP